MSKRRHIYLALHLYNEFCLTFRSHRIIYSTENDRLKNLRDSLRNRALEVAIINDEQFVIERKATHLIELVATIPKQMENLRERLQNGALDVCNIDFQQYIVKRNNFLIEIVSPILPMSHAPTSESSVPIVVNQAPNATSVSNAESNALPSVNIQPISAPNSGHDIEMSKALDTVADISVEKDVHESETSQCDAARDSGHDQISAKMTNNTVSISSAEDSGDSSAILLPNSDRNANKNVRRYF